MASIQRCLCGREYEVTRRGLVEPDPDSFYCECGEELLRWKGLVTYSVKLIKDIPQERIPKRLVSEPSAGEKS
jgi:hypothetical protein